MQVMLMRLMSKGEYVIVPKERNSGGAGKLGLKYQTLHMLLQIQTVELCSIVQHR